MFSFVSVIVGLLSYTEYIELMWMFSQPETEKYESKNFVTTDLPWARCLLDATRAFKSNYISFTWCRSHLLNDSHIFLFIVNSFYNFWKSALPRYKLTGRRRGSRPRMKGGGVADLEWRRRGVRPRYWSSYYQASKI